MKKEYSISGMGCSGCVARVKNMLMTIPGIDTVEVKLDAPQAVLTMKKMVSLEFLQMSLHRMGHYTIRNYKKQESLN